MKRCAVVEVRQSPLCRYRWLVRLRCGREAWVTRIRRPRMRGLECSCEGKGGA